MSDRLTQRFFPADIYETDRALRSSDYLPAIGLSAAIFLAVRMRRPLLLEGEPGVGKTEVARTLAALCDAELIRLQCYEGIDAAQALYDWDYGRQLLATRVAGDDAQLVDFYNESFLIERPLLRALRAGDRSVLLIDELDRADDQFDAFLLELLSDFSITIPEVGTVSAPVAPIVVLTSNRTRELHDALKRRCLYHWIEFPDAEREAQILKLRVPEASAQLVRSVAETVARVRKLGLLKRPGAAEAIDWARALTLVGAEIVTPEAAAMTLGSLLKNEDDMRLLRAGMPAICAALAPEETQPPCA